MMMNSVPAPAPTTPLQPFRNAASTQQTPADVVRVGVLGYGTWGPNHPTNLGSLRT